MKRFKNIGTSNYLKDEKLINKLISPDIDIQNNTKLCKIPDETEIKNTLFGMNQWGSLGPDGFPPGFFKNHREIVKTDIINIVQDFFKNKYILKDINYTHITFFF